MSSSSGCLNAQSTVELVGGGRLVVGGRRQVYCAMGGVLPAAVAWYQAGRIRELGWYAMLQRNAPRGAPILREASGILSSASMALLGTNVDAKSPHIEIQLPTVSSDGLMASLLCVAARVRIYPGVWAGSACPGALRPLPACFDRGPAALLRSPGRQLVGQLGQEVGGDVRYPRAC